MLLLLLQYPLETYGYGLLFSVSGYLGIQIVLTMVQSNGAFVAVTVTTCRKAITILLSFLFFYKPFTMQYLWSGIVVILGIYLNILSKQRGSKFELKSIWLYVKRCWVRHNQIQRQLMTSV